MVAPGPLGGAVDLRFRHRARYDGVGQMNTMTESRIARLRRTRPRLLMLANWLAQFALVFFILFYAGIDTAHGLISLQMSSDEIVRVYGFSDAGSYLQAAQNLIANGRSTPEFAWVLNLWPPGMVWMNALILYASPLPFALTFALVSALVWSVSLAVVTWHFVKSARSIVLVFALELLVLSTSSFQSWVLDEGLLYADGLAGALLLLTFALIANRAIKPDVERIIWARDGIFAGIALAATIYLRSSYQLVPWVLVGVAAIVTIAAIITKRRKQPTKSLISQLILLTTSLISLGVLLAPYTLYLAQERDRTQFVITENLVYEHVWEDRVKDEVPEWMAEAGSTLGCDLDTKTCDEVRDDEAAGKPWTSEELRDALIGTIVAHPGEFVAHRVFYVVKQWFADETARSSDSSRGFVVTNLNIPQGLTYLTLLVVAFGAAVTLVRRGHWIALTIPLAMLGILAPFAIVHVEARYLIPLKLLALLAPMLVLAVKKAKSRETSAAEEINLDVDTQLPESPNEVPSEKAIRSDSSAIEEGK